MAYATPADLKAVLPPNDLAQLTDFEGEADLPVDERIARAIDDASAEIDSWIGRQVALPLADPPHILNVICRDLTLHRLYLNLGYDAERIRYLRKDRMDWLESVADGRISLGDDDQKPTPTSGGVALTDGPERVLTRDSLKGY